MNDKAAAEREEQRAQANREYKRLFGIPPMRDVQRMPGLNERLVFSDVERCISLQWYVANSDALYLLSGRYSTSRVVGHIALT